VTTPFTYTAAWPRFHKARGQAGFTLIELLVTVAVFAILLAIGVPSFQNISASTRLSSQTNDMVSALSLARSEAIRRGTRVTMCKSSDGSTCVTSGDWEQGWITFVDTTRSSSDAEVDSGETILSVHQGEGGSVQIKGSASLADYVSFSADGQPKQMDSTVVSGTLRVCNTAASLGDDARARDIALSAVGRVSTTTPSSVSDTCPSP
jgi:type IV fimbrial biogenesis protein FimT